VDSLKLLCLTRFAAAGASSRYRMYQYLPRLRACGFGVDVEPLFDDRYIANINTGAGQRPVELLWATVRRVLLLRRVRRYDLVWVEKEILPFVPDVLEQVLRAAGVRMVVDYDDATFHRYDQHASSLVRRALGRKIDRVMASAALVVAGNEYLADRARAAGAPRVELLPTVIDLDRYPRTAPARPDGQLTVGWIGSPTTQRYLLEVGPALATFCRERDARLVAIGARADFTVPGVPLEVVRWSEDGEVAALQQLDIGIMPLTDSPWERGKCGLKLIQYMGCGVPVIASPVGVNREIVVPGETGFLAPTGETWLAALRELGGSAELRARMGGAGRARAEARYSLHVAAPRLVEMLRRAAPSERAGPRLQPQARREGNRNQH
jgi:glycosyltransferase involved in cell wall biosynthesis